MQINIECLKKACEQEKIEYKIIHEAGSFIRVFKNDNYFDFIANQTPLNSQAASKVSIDKEFHYEILKNHSRMPKTVSIFYPEASKKYEKHKDVTNYIESADKVEKELSYPLVLKMNRGSRGLNVFVVNNREELIQKLKIIFNKDSKDFDYVALAQEMIQIKNEFRVVFLDNEIKLVYEKVKGKNKNSSKINISPLHTDESRAELVVDSELINRIGEFIEPVLRESGLRYGGLDVAVDINNELVLIEINSAPSFDYFIRDNGDLKIVELYRDILKVL